MSPEAWLEGVVIDTGGLDKFFTPDTALLSRYWQRFQKGVTHYITPIIYWEFLNGLDQYNPMRKRFLRKLDENEFVLLPFERADAENAVQISRELRAIVDALPKSKKSKRLETVQRDVFIAATALRHRKRVFTMDTQDWLRIRDAIKRFSSQNLDLIFGSDINPEPEER